MSGSVRVTLGIQWRPWTVVVQGSMGHAARVVVGAVGALVAVWVL